MDMNNEPGGVVDQRVLEQGPEDECDADAGPDVDGLGVGHGRQWRVDGGLRGRHGQERRHAQRHSRGNLF